MKACLDIEKFKTICKSEERRCGRCKAEFLSKLLIYSVLYGLFSINYIDLVVPGSNVPGYHLWLLIAYFAPFIPLLLLFGFEDWELVGGLGLTASLMNDIFYYPIGMLLLKRPVNLYQWYSFQFGLKGLDVWWNFNAGFFMIPVTSLLMGLTIYLRIGIVVVLIYKWWNYKRTCSKPASRQVTVARALISLKLESSELRSIVSFYYKVCSLILTRKESKRKRVE